MTTKVVPKFIRMTPILTVSDMERSIAFYTAVLGFELIQRVKKDGETCFAIMTSGGVEWMLQTEATVAAGQEPPARMTCYVDVSDVTALYAAVRSDVDLREALHRAPHGLLEFYIRDPDGHSIGFCQPE